MLLGCCWGPPTLPNRLTRRITITRIRVFSQSQTRVIPGFGTANNIFLAGFTRSTTLKVSGFKNNHHDYHHRRLIAESLQVCFFRGYLNFVYLRFSALWMRNLEVAARLKKGCLLTQAISRRGSSIYLLNFEQLRLLENRILHNNRELVSCLDNLW